MHRVRARTMECPGGGGKKKPLPPRSGDRRCPLGHHQKVRVAARRAPLRGQLCWPGVVYSTWESGVVAPGAPVASAVMVVRGLSVPVGWVAFTGFPGKVADLLNQLPIECRSQGLGVLDDDLLWWHSMLEERQGVARTCG